MTLLFVGRNFLQKQKVGRGSNLTPRCRRWGRGGADSQAYREIRFTVCAGGRADIPQNKRQLSVRILKKCLTVELALLYPIRVHKPKYDDHCQNQECGRGRDEAAKSCTKEEHGRQKRCHKQGNEERVVSGG